MVVLSQILATFGFLLPVLLFVWFRSSRERALWEIGLDLPMAVCLDLLFVLSLTLVFRLEFSTFLSRVVYLLGFAVLAFYRRRRGRPLGAFPTALGRAQVLGILVSTLLAFGLSFWLSRTYVIWDRGWHIPLVASIRGQTLPFKNAFSVHETLHYHFAGDVHAAMLQSLSLSVFHSSLALSLLHDIYFALTGMFLAFFIAWWGYRRVGAYVLGTAAVLLTGPTHLFREGIRAAQEGHSFVSHLSFSFRPQSALGAFLMLGFVGAVAARLGSRDDLDWRKTAPPMCACAAGLSLTDETTLGLLGLTLGLTWLFAPRVVFETRKVGVFVFLALVAALLVPNLAFSASLAPGHEPHTFKFVFFRSPGYYRAILPLTTQRGWVMLWFDLVGPALVGLGALMMLLRNRWRGRGVWTAFYIVFFLLSVLLLTTADVSGVATESHRFAVGVFLIGPFVALGLLSNRFSAALPVLSRSPYASSVMAGGMAAAALSTLDWSVSYAPSWAARPRDFGRYDFYTTNCRESVGVSVGLRPQYTAIARSAFYLVAGCRPTFTPARVWDSTWKTITIGIPFEHQEETIDAVRAELPKGAPIPLVCPVVLEKNDAFCHIARASKSCRPGGLFTQDCEITPEQAQEAARLSATRR